VARASVAAAVGLTTLKGVVGISTGSLGILSEALHSLLDLAAALLTLVAVRASARPADERHSYGHGKVENVSALAEGLLLVATCVWIVAEALSRLASSEIHVQVTVWSFAVMGTSIVVDLTRARALRRTARKYQSQALEADALHFSTDVWSSLVVILGLGCVALAEPLGAPWLAKADAVAALGVAGIVVWITVNLLRRTLADLLDEAPPGLREHIAAAVHLPGVMEVGRVRVRRSGPESFVDLTLRVGGDTSLTQGHAIADEAEAAVHQILPGSDVVVHVEPSPEQGSAATASAASELAVARRIASEHQLAAHDLHFQDVLGQQSLELHVEVPAHLDVATAHARTSAFEEALRRALPALERIVSHIEPAPAGDKRPVSVEEVTALLRAAIAEVHVACQPHELHLDAEHDVLHLSFHCSLPPELPITAAHGLTERIEEALRARLPQLGRVVIHVEPSE
jgi:cation diffusion facilitator family transporter